MVRPSGRSTVMARLSAPHGNFATSTSIPSACACASVRPHHAISGSVNTTAGIACGSNTALWPAIASTATRASCDALCASIGSPATSPIAKIVGSAVRRCGSVSMNPFGSTFTCVVSRPGIFEFGRRPMATSTRSKTCSFSATSPSNVTRMPWPSSATLTTLVFSMIAANSFFSRFSSTADEIAIGPGQQPRRHLDDRHLAAERGVDRAQLEADVAPADHQQRLRHVGKLEARRRVHHARAVERERRNLRRLRAGRENQCSNCSSVVPPCAGNRHRVRTGQRGASLNERDLAQLGDAANAGGQLVDDALLERAQLVDVDLRLAERHAPVRRRAWPRR